MAIVTLSDAPIDRVRGGTLPIPDTKWKKPDCVLIAALTHGLVERQC
jgi:hypothetical protein